MSMTRREILVGAGGVIAVSAVDAASAPSVIATKAQAAHPKESTNDGRKKATGLPKSGTRELNGIYYGD